MSGFSSAFKHAMVDCEIIRNNIKIATYKGLISDSKDFNVISFDCKSDVQVGDDIYCPLKNKHYIITNTDIKLFNGKPHRLDAFFENNFIPKTSNTIFNTYNPSNSIIGSQQFATINISDSFNNLNEMIDKFGAEDKQQLLELVKLLQVETNNQVINKSLFKKFGSLISKYSWLAPCISQIIAAWIQQ